MIDFHLVVIMIEVFKEALTGKYIPQRSCEEENKQEYRLNEDDSTLRN